MMIYHRGGMVTVHSDFLFFFSSDSEFVPHTEVTKNLIIVIIIVFVIQVSLSLSLLFSSCLQWIQFELELTGPGGNGSQQQVVFCLLGLREIFTFFLVVVFAFNYWDVRERDGTSGDVQQVECTQ